MKNIKLFIIAVFMLATTACENLLTEEPVSFLAPDNLTSLEGAEAVLKGAYDGLQGYYTDQFWAAVEYQCDFQFTRGSRVPHGFYNMDTRNIGRMQNVWGGIYSAINRANLIISSFPDLDFDEKLKGQWVAEAQVLRAFHYFNLVRGWGGRSPSHRAP